MNKLIENIIAEVNGLVEVRHKIGVFVSKKGVLKVINEQAKAYNVNKNEIRCDCSRCKNSYPCESTTGFCKNFSPTYVTNADYIRNMTDDELTTFLASIDHLTDEGECIVVFEGEPMLDDIVSIEEWLKAEREG